jgi:hypothetical protein
MRGPEFLGDHRAFLAAFASLCDWADLIVVCTRRIDVGEGWLALMQSIAKVRHCMVSDHAPSLAALGPFQAKGVLHLVGDQGSRFHPNVYLFRRGREVRVLIGSAGLIKGMMENEVESVTRIDASEDDPFACGLADFIESCLAKSRLPVPGDLIADAPSPTDSDDRDETKRSSKHLEGVLDARIGKLLPVRDAGRVQSSHHEFWSVLVAHGTRLRVEIGRRRRVVIWNSYLGFWAARLKSAERFWYVFGARDPRGIGPPDATLIVIIASDRYDPKTSGAFAVEPEHERLFLVHRGGFSDSGREGKRLFWRTTRLRGTELQEDGEKTARVALVAEVNTSETLKELAAYIREVDRLRRIGRQPAGDGAIAERPDGQACDLFIEVRDADERASLVWLQLLGSGVQSKDECVRKAALGLRKDGRADFRRLDSSGPLYEAILDSIKHGVRTGLLDRPSRGYVRAVLESAQEYPDWLWQLCILGSLDREFVSRDDAVRKAARWAVDNVGLRHRNLRNGGKVDDGLRRALTGAIRQGKVLKQGRDLVRLADES